MPFLEFTEYLQWEKKYSSHTIRAYLKDLNEFKTFTKEKFQQQEIITANYAIIRTWIVALVNQEISNRTINRKISSLKAYYNYLLKSRQIKVSPLVKHKSLKVSKKVQIPFSKQEVSEVINLLSQQPAGFKETRDKFIIELLYSTGMRRAELINLKVDDVNISSQTIKVLGKRNKERIIPLLPSLVPSFNNYVEERKLLSSIVDDAHLFLTHKGVKIYDTLVYRIINGYFSKVSTKLKKSPHIIRHSFATHLLNEGANLNAVKELLGHASLASTQVYTHNSIRELSDIYKKSHPRNQRS